MKRSLDLNSNEIFDDIINSKPKIKRSRLTSDTNMWVTGTNICNYLLGEPLLDWLNLFYSKLKFNEDVNIIKTRSKSSVNFATNNDNFATNNVNFATNNVNFATNNDNNVLIYQ